MFGETLHSVLDIGTRLIIGSLGCFSICMSVFV